MGTQLESNDRDFFVRVDLTKPRPFVPSLVSDLKETFFPDDPFLSFKDLSTGRRVWGTFQYYVPILEWAPRYTLSKFRYDLLAGITIASLAIPQGISYARLAQLPPIIGLCELVSLICFFVWMSVCVCAFMYLIFFLMFQILN